MALAKQINVSVRAACPKFKLFFKPFYVFDFLFSFVTFMYVRMILPVNIAFVSMSCAWFSKDGSV